MRFGYWFTPIQHFDPAGMRTVVSAASIEHVQLGRGRFDGEVRRLVLGRSVLNFGSYNLSVLARGGLESGSMSIGFLMKTSSGGYLNGHCLLQGDIVVFAEGAEIHYRHPEKSIWVMYQIPRAELQQMALAVTGAPFNLPVRGCRVFRPSPEQAAQLAARIWHTFGYSAQVNGPGERTLSLVNESLFRSFVLALDSAECQFQTRYQSSGLARFRTLRRAEDYLLSHPQFRMRDLCEYLGTSERMLQYVYRSTHGMSLRSYTQYRRLCGARGELMAARPHRTRVTEIAMNWGFFHLGRFSVTYREMFGESPAQTLGREPEPLHLTDTAVQF